MGVTHFVWDHLNDSYLLESDDAGATTVVYTQEPKQYGALVSERRGEITRFVHQDALGSTMELTDNSGAVTDSFRYTAWGEEIERTGSSTLPFRWIGSSGYFWDNETASHYIRARVYQPQIARWCSVDPLWFDSPTTCGYQYCMLQSTRCIDPSGALLVAIDGSDTASWLEPTDPDMPFNRMENTRWLSHVRNFWAEYAQTTGADNARYLLGPNAPGLDAELILQTAYYWVCRKLKRKCEPLDIIGWSRGGFLANELARKLDKEGCRTVGVGRLFPVIRFLGMYDPVDMSPVVGDWGREKVPSNVKRAVAVLSSHKPSRNETMGYDYNKYCQLWQDWPRFQASAADATATNVTIERRRATHGAIGGCPGYSGPTVLPYDYVYGADKFNSEESDRTVRGVAIAAGVPVSQVGDYGFGEPADLPERLRQMRLWRRAYPLDRIPPDVVRLPN